MKVPDMTRAYAIADVMAERAIQDAKWGEQNHPDGTGTPRLRVLATEARIACDEEFENGNGTWALILHEEFSEALAEDDPAKLREELVQVAAVTLAWVEAIDRRLRDA